jgi:hemoglobin
MATLPDITTAADVRVLIDTFYSAARPDPVIGHFFTHLDWDTHLPRIRSFWEMILFGDRAFQGDPMTVHLQLHQRIPMEAAHFDRWLGLFDATVDGLFAGPKATEAKQRARSIADIMAHKVGAR